MPLTESMIVSAINEKLKTGEWKQGVVHEAKSKGIGLGGGREVKPEEMRKQAQVAASDLYDEIVKFIPSFDRNAIIIGPTIEESEGRYSITLSFESSALFRPTMAEASEDKPISSIASQWRRVSKLGSAYGTDNIVLQFEKGWEARGAVYGQYNGRRGYSRDRYNPQYNFMQRAVDLFNSAAPSYVTAVLVGEYA